MWVISPLSPEVTSCTTSLTFSNSTFCPHSVFMCFVWIWEQTAIISLYSINWLVFITETGCVYCAVRTGSLYIIQVNLHFNGLIIIVNNKKSSPQTSVPHITSLTVVVVVMNLPVYNVCYTGARKAEHTASLNPWMKGNFLANANAFTGTPPNCKRF